VKIFKFQSAMYGVHIQQKHVTVLSLKKEKNGYSLIESHVLEKEKISHFLQEKNNLYVTIALDEVIDETITLPSSIKKKNLIESYIRKQFQNSISPSQHLLINFKKIDENKEEKKVRYKVDAIDEKSYMQELSLLPNWSAIRSATIDKFSLLALCKQCFQPKNKEGFFCIHIYPSMIIVLAVNHKYEVILERSTKLQPASQNINNYIAEYIHQTVNYVQHQLRETDFSTLLISGAFSIDDLLAQELLVMTSMNIAVLYPNGFIRGLEADEAQEYIMALGSIFVEKEMMFLPKQIRSIKQYEIASKAVLSGSALLFGISIYGLNSHFQAYSQELERYDTIKSKLIKLIKETDTYSFKELELSWKQLQIAEKYLQFHPLDILIELKPVLQQLPLQTMSFKKEKNEDLRLQLYFEKGFGTLQELYNFEKKFQENFSHANMQNKYTLTNKTDYKKLLFRAYISTIKKSQKRAATSHRRRRR